MIGTCDMLRFAHKHRSDGWIMIMAHGRVAYHGGLADLLGILEIVGLMLGWWSAESHLFLIGATEASEGTIHLESQERG